jgi:hypothetical protein
VMSVFVPGARAEARALPARQRRDITERRAWGAGLEMALES